MVEFTDCDPPATEEQIQAFEATVGCRFPPRLRRLFLETNGGRPNPDGYRDEENDTDVSECLALREGRGSVQHIYDIAVRQKRLVPEHFVPFACDSCGDFFYVDCDSPEALVYLYVHDTAYEHFRPLGITMDELFSRLTAE